ncbi:MAG: tetratricopeptide repeat protein [Elusimicrobia bacterium]|nr:tetratricopeptide repeat protein [Elusimicrobiota bacterium]
MKKLAFSPDSWPVLSALLMLAAAYLPALGAPFVWDDLGWILFNRSLDQPIPLSGYLGNEYFSLSGETSWRPLATLTYNALSLAAGKSPLAFRSLSLLLHLLAASLYLRLLIGSGLPFSAAAMAAALFMVHPANVETLMCASFNEELLVACALLGMVVAHRAGKPLLAGVAFLAGLLSKETAVLGLPLVFLYDWSHKGLSACKRSFPAYISYTVVAVAFGWFSVFGLSAPGMQAKAAVPVFDRLCFALESLWAFVRVQVLPLGLRIEYFALPTDSTSKALGLTAFAAGVAVAAGLVLRKLWRGPEKRPWAFYLAWPFLFWFVSSGAAPAGVLTTRLLAERWLYLPMLGSAALAALALQRRPKVSAAVLACLGILMFARTRDWADERRLWGSLVRQYPWSAKAHEGLGDACSHFRDYGPALASYEEALRLRETRQDPLLRYYVPISGGRLNWQSPSLRRSLGGGYFRAGAFSRAEPHLAKAIELDPRDPFAYRLLGYLRARQGRFAEARRWADQGLSKNPQDEFLLRLAKDAGAKRLTFQPRMD